MITGMKLASASFATTSANLMWTMKSSTARKHLEYLVTTRELPSDGVIRRAVGTVLDEPDRFGMDAVRIAHRVQTVLADSQQHVHHHVELIADLLCHVSGHRNLHEVIDLPVLEENKIDILVPDAYYRNHQINHSR